MSRYDASLLEIDGYPISWKKIDLPIGCFFGPDLDKHIVAAYRIVAVELNHLIGCELLGLGSQWALGDLPLKTPRGYLAITDFIPLPNTVGETLYGYASPTVLKDRILSVDMKIRRGMDSEFLLTVMRHEMGHVLGLAHDERQDSIMSRTIGINPPPDAQFTDHDISLLQKLYT